MKKKIIFFRPFNKFTFSSYCFWLLISIVLWCPMNLLHGRCAAAVAGFWAPQDVQYEKIAMDWVMEYQPERYNVLMRRPPLGGPGKCIWLRLDAIGDRATISSWAPQNAFGCIWLIGEQGKVSGYGSRICPSWILLVGLLRVSAARLVSQIEKGWWKEVPLTCYSANMVASQVGAFIRFMKLAHFPSHEGWWSCLISIDIHCFLVFWGGWLSQQPVQVGRVVGSTWDNFDDRPDKSWMKEDLIFFFFRRWWYQLSPGGGT